MTNTMSAHNQKSQVRSTPGRNRNTITCSICQATYAPKQEFEYLLHAPPMALESAFMSMCHFCFRCRRPACPSCWDYVHGVCGSCTLEARLPFRSRVDPLHGVSSPPVRQIQFKRKRSARLICIRSGRFQNTISTDSTKTVRIKTTMPQNSSPLAQVADTTSDSSRQLRIADPKTKITHTRSPLPPVTHTTTNQTIPPPTTVINIDEIDTQPKPKPKSRPRTHIAIDKIETRPHPTSRPHPRPISIDEINTQPAPRNHATTNKNDAQPRPRNSMSPGTINIRPKRHNNLARQIKHIITSLLALLLLLIILLIVFAEASQDANTFILHAIHVDIRVEIAYILQLVRQIFS